MISSDDNDGGGGDDDDNGDDNSDDACIHWMSVLWWLIHLSCHLPIQPTIYISIYLST